MKILLFGGFLGSGKTTTILQVAKQITEVRGETAAIIENEIGEAGVDDQLLLSTGLQIRPLFGGCVCCQITGDLVTAVNEIQQAVNPDWLIIEMTGLAVPGNIVGQISKYCVSQANFKTVTLVDGARWAELKEVLEPLIVEQVKKSDLILINKIDVTGQEISAVIRDVQSVAGQTTILTASAAGELPPAVFEEVFRFG